MNWQVIDVGLLTLPFIAGLLVLITHVPLGAQILQRGIVFADLAIAQIAGLGVVASSAIGLPTDSWLTQIVAIASALIGAMILRWTEKNTPEQQEALIGVLFVLAATATIILVSHNPHGGENLQNLLGGQILWVDIMQIKALAVVSVFVMYGLKKKWDQSNNRYGFYLIFSIAVTASVQLVGIYLVFASLIIPALTTRHLPDKKYWSLFFGSMGYALGLIVSALFDWPSGAVIVWALVVCSLIGHQFIRIKSTA
ncbi:MAG: metal ABC transporter permease [Limnohabitans sp.]|nr:metal ABC transporter permease [Limnohabitans sp.]